MHDLKRSAKIMRKIIISIVLAATIAAAYFIGGTHAAQTAMREANLTTLNNLALLERTLEREGPEKAKAKIKSQMKGTLEVFENFDQHPISLGAIFIIKPEGLLWTADAEEKIVQNTKASLKCSHGAQPAASAPPLSAFKVSGSACLTRNVGQIKL
jgi:hypothetical protein